jgi:hypothetical protein
LLKSEENYKVLRSEPAMAGVGMENMYMNILCISILVGVNSTLNTLVS